MNTITLPLFLVLTLTIAVNGKYMKPIFETELSDIAEPSGVTFCESSGTIWMICDSCFSIYETTHKGNIINEWKYDSKHHKDTEGVTCDDTNQLIHIALEGRMDIISFVLPHKDLKNTYTTNDDGSELYLIELTRTHVDIDDLKRPEDDDDNLPGLEGITWIPSFGAFMTANEKEPSMLVSVSSTGEILNVEETHFSDDLSGLAYDNELNLLWVLSDRTEEIFLTDITGRYLFGTWQVPTHHPEGIAINNLVDPPLMFIVTDPSSPHGTPYISSLLVFRKPDVLQDIQVVMEAKQNNHENVTFALSIVALCLVLVACLLALITLCSWVFSRHCAEKYSLWSTSTEAAPRWKWPYCCSPKYVMLSHNESSNNEDADEDEEAATVDDALLP